MGEVRRRAAPKKGLALRLAGAAYQEWVNEMSEWSRLELQQVIDHADTGEPIPVMQVAAARDLIRASSDDRSRTTGGFLHSDSLNRVLDRTAGKPTQAIKVDHGERFDEVMLTLEQAKEGLTLDLRPEKAPVEECTDIMIVEND